MTYGIFGAFQSESTMAGAVFTLLRDGLKGSPLLTNICLGFILVAVEKFTDMQFECPCKAKHNEWFTSAFCIIPAVMAFFLMLIILFPGDCKWGLDKCKKEGCHWPCMLYVLSSSFVPCIVWMILVCFDGRYIACAMTKTECNGKYSFGAGGRRYCEAIPNVTESGDKTTTKCMQNTSMYIFHSQVAGVVLLILLCLGLVIFAIYVICFKKNDKPNTAKHRTEDLEVININLKDNKLILRINKTKEGADADAGAGANTGAGANAGAGRTGEEMATFLS